MKRDHVGGENMIDEKALKFFWEYEKSSSRFTLKDEDFILELLYRSFKYKNERKFNKEAPKMNQKDANKLISQRYQNVSMKKGVNKSALYCGKVKF